MATLKGRPLHIYYSKGRSIMNEKSLDNQCQMFTSSLSENRESSAFCEELGNSTLEEFIPLSAELNKKNILIRRDILYSSSQEYRTFLFANKKERNRFLKKIKC